MPTFGSNLDNTISAVGHKAAWLGFCIAAPRGPISILVLRLAMQKGCSAGLAGGLGAALADLLSGVLAVAGSSTSCGTIVTSTGGLMLLYRAWRSWRASRRRKKPSWGAERRPRTLSDPMTLLSFAAIVVIAPAVWRGGQPLEQSLTGSAACDTGI